MHYVAVTVAWHISCCSCRLLPPPHSKLITSILLATRKRKPRSTGLRVRRYPVEGAGSNARPL